MGRQSSNQHAGWYDRFNQSLLSLLTCLRPTSPPSLITEVQGPSPALPPSTLYATCPPPSAFLVPKRLRCQHKRQSPLSHPPHRSTLSLSSSLTGPNTVHALPLSHMPLPFLDRAMLPPKGAPTSLSTRPRYSTGPRSPVPPSLRMPSHHWS